VAFEESEDGRVEGVVAVAGDHVVGAGDVGVLGVRDELQEIVDAFFQDIDYSIRELGIGDNTVPKRMKKLAGMFYGRLEAYAKAMDTRDAEGLAAALVRNIHPKANEPVDMRGLADWMFVAEDHLLSQSEDVIATGSATLPKVA